MKRKRLITLGVVTLVMTGSSAAYGALTETGVFASSNTTEVAEQLVTKPAPIINSLVQREILVSGPVKEVTLEAGPIFSSDAPIVGSLDWMAQEKAEKDRLKLDADRKQAALVAEATKVQTELEAEIARLEKIASDTKILNEALVLVKKQVGKTPWVFSGSSPSAWDCSGMVRWTYARLGVDLVHRASVQRNSGEIVTKPKIGDLVSFNYRSYNNASHIGIYIGPDEMIHAGGKPGDRTEIRSIKDWSEANGNSEVIYTRIVETNN